VFPSLASAYCKIKNRPHARLVMGAFCIAFVGLCALGGGMLAPTWLAYSLAIALACVLLLLPISMAMGANLRAKLNDVQDAISLENGLRRAGYELTDFFTDEAAGNPSLQLLHFKILRLCRPQQILELGSGQTTKLLSCYQRQNPSAYILTLEQDERWQKQIREQVAHDCRHVSLEPKEFTCAGTGLKLRTHWYQDLPELHQRKFDYMLVDGPDHGGPGTDHVDYARSGILRYMPDILADHFVIVFDDAERRGESMTIKALDAILRAGAIRFVRFARYGIKTQAVFCSPDFAFLRSS
jgi:hypothetical protein